jgi:hypothetical protein
MNQIAASTTDDKIHGIFNNLFTVKNFAKKNKEVGAWPASESAIWALRAGSPENGFANVFVTVGRRVLINEKKFREAISLLQEKKNEYN